MKNLFLMLALLISFGSTGQITNENYFFDTTYGYLDMVFDRIEMEDGIILSGRVENGPTQDPVMLKIDLNGDVVWSTFNENKFGESDCDYFEINLFDDGYIYGFSRVEAAQWEEKRRIWKVNPVNGHVEYIANFYDGSNRRIDMADYNDSVFVALFINYNGFTLDNAYIAYMDKTTGDTIETQFITNLNLTLGIQSIQIEVDESKNIYYAIDHQLTKLNRGDLDFPLWTRDYSSLIPTPIEVSDELYFDQYDQLFLMGHEEVSGTTEYPTVVKVNKETGLADWHYSVPIAPSHMSGYADDQDFLYTTYTKHISGSSNIGLRVVKLRKSDGNVEWNVGQNTTVLGAGLVDNAESGVALDVDCSGDVYATGFYNDDFYYGAWSIQKLSGVDGSVIDEYTITEDSVTVDNWSMGLVSCVIRDTAYFIGQLETTPGSSLANKSYFVSIDPVSSNILNRRFIYGGFQLPSKTLDIVNRNDTMYVLKQVGELGVVEAYDVNNNLMWQNYLDDTGVLQAGQISVNDNSVVVSAQVNNSDGIVPYYNNECEKLVMYSMNLFGGGFTSDEILMYGAYVKTLELESDYAGSYILYQKDNEVILREWSIFGGGFGNEIVVELASANTQFEGNINIIHNHTIDSLLIIGTTELYWYNKQSNSINSFLTYNGTKNYLDHLIMDSIIYAVGSNPSQEQAVTAFNLNQVVVEWDQVYLTGEFSQIGRDFNNQIFLAGVHDTTLVAHKISGVNGAVLWSYSEDPLIYPNSIAIDMEVNQFKGYIAIVGLNSNSSTNHDGIITLLNFPSGDTLYTHALEDQKIEISQGYCVGISKDSLTWVGGAHNRSPQLREGFLHLLNFDLDSCGTYNSTVVETVCDSYTSPLGNVWDLTGVYTETIPSLNGCDSTITFDITIPILNSTVIETVCGSYTSPSGTVWDLTGVYTEIIPSSNGCDSTVTFDITIPILITTVTQVDSSLTSDALGVNYQWVDCDNNYAEIPGATNQEFIATQNGNFGVVVYEGTCSDTSICYSVATLGHPAHNASRIKCYPNPVENNLHIFNPTGEVMSIKLVDPLGRLVHDGIIESKETVIDMNFYSTGIYLLHIQSGNERFTFKIQKN